MNINLPITMLAAATDASGGGALKLAELVKYGTMGLAVIALILSFWLLTQANKETNQERLALKIGSAEKFRLTCIIMLCFGLTIEVIRIFAPKDPPPPEAQVKALVSFSPFDETDFTTYGKADLLHRRENNERIPIPLVKDGHQLLLKPNDAIVVDVSATKKKFDLVLNDLAALKNQFVKPAVETSDNKFAK